VQRRGDVAPALETQDGDGEVAQAGHGPRALPVRKWEACPTDAVQRIEALLLGPAPGGGDPLTVAAIPAAVVKWAIFRGIRAWYDRADRRAIRTALADLTNTRSLDWQGQGPADAS
jgi:hypothetical protein